LASAVNALSSNSQAISEIIKIVQQFLNEYKMQIDWSKLALGLGKYALSNENQRAYIDPYKKVPQTSPLYERVAHYGDIAAAAYDDKTVEMTSSTDLATISSIAGGIAGGRKGREKLEAYGEIIGGHDDSAPAAPAHWIIKPRNDSDPLLLVIRGTSNFGDVIMDLHASTVQWPGVTKYGYVHQGMLKAAQHVKNTLMPNMWIHTDRGSQARKLVCVGHSLGGAVATYVCQLLREDSFDVECYAFAPPPTFEKNACSMIKGVYSIVHRDDIVPRLCYMSLMDLMTQSMKSSGVEIDFGQFRGHDGVKHHMLYVPGLFIQKMDDDIEIIVDEKDKRKETRVILSSMCITDHYVESYRLKK